MKSRFFIISILLFLLTALSAQDAYPSEEICMDLMRRGTPSEIDKFINDFEGFPAYSEYINTYFYQAAYWNSHPSVMESLYFSGADLNALNVFDRTPLMAACRHNSAGMVEKLLFLGADPTLQDSNGQTALHFAAAYSHDPAVFRVFLNHKLSSSIVDNNRRTALELAFLRQDQQNVLLSLIKAWPDLNNQSSHGDNFYSLAFREDDLSLRSDLVSALFENGASLRLKNHKGLTPQEEALENGMDQLVHELAIYQDQLENDLKEEMQLFTDHEPRYLKVQELLSRGADPLILNSENLTPCQLAVIGGYPEILKLLLQYVEISEPFTIGLEDFNRNLLFFAISHSPEKSAALVKILLEQGFSPDLKDPEGNPLLTESLYNSLEVADLLLQAGADTEIRDSYGVSPLMRAGSLEYGAEAIDLLMSYGADLNAVDYDQWNALFYTVLFGGEENALQALIDYGIDLNDRDSYGSSVMLWAAAYHPETSILEFLSEKGATLNNRDKDGWIPLMAALNWANVPEVLDFLIKKAPDGRLYDGCGRSLDQLIDIYEKKSGLAVPGSMSALLGRRVYPPDSIPLHDLNTALFETAEWGSDPSLIGQLTHAGADINSVDENGWTPLMHGAAYNDLQMVQAVLDAGGDISYRTSRGWTALHVASWSDDPEIIKLLLQKGADLSSGDRENWTPLMWAARNHAPEESLKILLDAGADGTVLSLTGESALFLMVSGWVPPEERALKMILESGADIDRGNRKGMTALMKAAAMGYENTLNVLLKAGANPRLKDKSGSNAIDYAEAEGFSSLAELLRQF